MQAAARERATRGYGRPASSPGVTLPVDGGAIGGCLTWWKSTVGGSQLPARIELLPASDFAGDLAGGVLHRALRLLHGALRLQAPVLGCLADSLLHAAGGLVRLALGLCLASCHPHHLRQRRTRAATS